MTVTGLLVAALESVWAAIRRRSPDVPEVVLTIASGTTPAGLNLGHFAAFRWVRGDYEIHELFVGGEGLDRGPVDVLGTLLHEAAHGLAVVREIKDTSRQGRYHNHHYRELGEELGLNLDQDDEYGWTITTVPPKTQRLYRPQLDELDLALIAHRRREPEPPQRNNSNNGITAICQCQRRIRVAPSIFRRGAIICGVCGGSFSVKS
ncbi:hypothetical protein [Nocardia arthritidis]|uniref:SprT-like domain-containing protein n=1 Tax=Nocardia arthritidis TaxID=228602 RepID=A0A6G9YBT2_9NOCA|nr:hypothetical protein [Nocardia arthritidis]QIS10614.1 hypothetical protein F5544_13630 [Nocardia arthritidis]